MGGNDTTQSKRGIDSLFAVRLEEKDVNFPAKARKDNSYAAKKKVTGNIMKQLLSQAICRVL